VAERLESAGVGVERRKDGLHVADPSGNHIVLVAASP
jgi:hypothetical protein